MLLCSCGFFIFRLMKNKSSCSSLTQIFLDFFIFSCLRLTLCPHKPAAERHPHQPPWAHDEDAVFLQMCRVCLTLHRAFNIISPRSRSLPLLRLCHLSIKPRLVNPPGQCLLSEPWNPAASSQPPWPLSGLTSAPPSCSAHSHFGAVPTSWQSYYSSALELFLHPSPD